MSSDSEVIARSVRDGRVFGEIFERHAQDVAGFIVSRVGPAAKDDLLSETFLVAFHRRARFDAAADSARPWLLGIATRLIHKHRRMEAAHWRSFAACAGAGEHTTTADMDETVDRLDANLRIRHLAPRIAALSARDRDTLFLYAFGDLTYEQIAEALHVPVGTVRSRLNRIRQRLAAPASAPNTTNHTHSSTHKEGKNPHGSSGWSANFATRS